MALRDELQDVSRESVEQAVASMAGSRWTMKPRARKTLDVITLGVFPLIRGIAKFVQNRRAVKAGKPKPHDPAEIAQDLLDVAGEMNDTLRGKRK